MKPPNTTADPLTTDEKKIMYLVVRGKNSKEIADVMEKNKRSIEHYRRLIMKKLKASTPCQAAVKYYKIYDTLKKHSSFGGPDQPLSFIAEVVNKVVRELTEKKEILLKEALEKKGLVHLLETATHRFPKIKCEVGPTSETYWADDNTPEGLRIITFTDILIEDGWYKHSTDNKIEMKQEIKYH